MKTIFKGILVALMVMVASTTFAQSAQDVKYQGEVNVSYGISAKKDMKGVINFETIHGIRVNPNIAVGLGLGVNVIQPDYMNLDGKKAKKELFIPIFLDVKWYILSGNITPYLAVDLGYNFGIDDINEGEIHGLYFAPGAGVSFKMKDKGAFNLGIALRNNGSLASQGVSAALTSLDIKAAIVF